MSYGWCPNHQAMKHLSDGPPEAMPDGTCWECGVEPVDAPMTDRDALAALIQSTIRARYVRDDAPEDTAYISDDDPIDRVWVNGFADFRNVADAILAAGWRAPVKPIIPCDDVHPEFGECVAGPLGHKGGHFTGVYEDPRRPDGTHPYDY